MRGRGRSRLRHRIQRWWFTRVQPPGRPNVWLPIIALLLVGAVLMAWLVGSLAGEDVTGMARDLVKNPFRQRR